jgi:hypothetical protein
MAAVGYQQAYLDLDAHRAVARLGEKKIKIDVDDLFRISHDDMLYAARRPNGEKRSGWYAMGSAAIRLQKKAARNTALQQATRDVCLMMAESGRLLKGLLANDREWQPHEKRRFLDYVENEADGIRYVINDLTPDSCKDDSRLEDLAERYNVTITYAALPEVAEKPIFQFALDALVWFSRAKAKFQDAVRAHEHRP